MEYVSLMKCLARRLPLACPLCRSTYKQRSKDDEIAVSDASKYVAASNWNLMNTSKQARSES